MADFRSDQAAGLRRLFGGSGRMQAVTFVAGCEGVGRSVAVANIGAALARLGKEVLIIDEHAARDDVASGFGILARNDLLDVIEDRLLLSDVLVQPMNCLRVLPAAQAVRKLGRLSPAQQRNLVDAMTGLERPVDVMLIDASVSHPGGFSPLGMVSHEVVVMLSGNSASITEAYSLIKKVSQVFSRKHFRILVNKVRNVEDAVAIFDNISHVCHQRGIATLEYAGAIPYDEALKQSVGLCRPVITQAPESPSSNVFRDLAADIQYWQCFQESGGGVEHFLRQLLNLSQRITPNLLRA